VSVYGGEDIVSCGKKICLIWTLLLYILV